MSKQYAVLPCNGMDKCAGSVSRQIALDIKAETGSEILCPVFYRVADAGYNKLAAQLPLLVIDGCPTRCASKLAAEKELKISERVVVTEEAKAAGITLSDGLELGEQEHELAASICHTLTSEKTVETQQDELLAFPAELDYEVYKKDKFKFRVPKNEGFYFNENDVWAYVVGNRARIGVTDFVQQSLSDIMFFTPPSIGMEVSQFEEAGDVESSKAVFELVSPVSGKVVAVNDRLSDEPELINQNPYEQGWIAEILLEDFEDDKDLLHDFEGYFPILKRKVDGFNV